jgi:hypothetical protein
MIEISHAHLALLPEDDVPVEILSIIRQCKDDGIVLQESAGYVPSMQGEQEEVSRKSLICLIEDWC